MTNDLHYILSADTHGSIIRRQSTFWEVELPDSDLYRIHFLGKYEFHFLGEEFYGLALHEEHPLLMDYFEEWQDMYFSSAVPHPDPLIEKLSKAVREITDNWRSLERYLNTQLDARSLLQSGNGRLLAGPGTMVRALVPIIKEYGVTPSILKGRPASGTPRVLMLGSNFVVADTFRVQKYN